MDLTECKRTIAEGELGQVIDFLFEKINNLNKGSQKKRIEPLEKSLIATSYLYKDSLKSYRNQFISAEELRTIISKICFTLTDIINDLIKFSEEKKESKNVKSDIENFPPNGINIDHLNLPQHPKTEYSYYKNTHPDLVDIFHKDQDKSQSITPLYNSENLNSGIAYYSSLKKIRRNTISKPQQEFDNLSFAKNDYSRLNLKVDNSSILNSQNSHSYSNPIKTHEREKLNQYLDPIYQGKPTYKNIDRDYINNSNNKIQKKNNIGVMIIGITIASFIGILLIFSFESIYNNINNILVISILIIVSYFLFFSKVFRF